MVDSNIGSEAGQGDSNDANPSAGNSDQAVSARHPFFNLPPELILDIVELLQPEAFINFDFANYPLLHAYGLAPALSRSRIVYLTNQTQIPALLPLRALPPEIMLQVLRRLKPIDTMRFAVANYQRLAEQGIAPPLSLQTMHQLRNAANISYTPGVLNFTRNADSNVE
ncbi:hypothetical protein LTR78_009221 [Recurvomyces mirabilis]|uniref:F-box domain-containing protein n=1 Tax=Recurvomyces mirabilis TaxID=574656 RepID=A0AAE0WIR3_9PEZI|nr:hypothetical protein LTR78_009221 [Recurvomyces mirabilis]KAK5155619.1 hypothetical protein LTS14_005880 [Recurvomyces mirabilis]